MVRTRRAARVTHTFVRREPSRPPPPASLDDARHELRAHGSGVEVHLQDVLASVARLGQLCSQAPAAHGTLNRQVQQMEDFFEAEEPAASGGDIAWMDALEDAASATHKVEEDIMEAAASLVGKLEEWAERSVPVRAAARRLRVIAAVRLNRQHNTRMTPLLSCLPKNALDIIARKMGKQARLLCLKLRDVYGSPGAVLAPPFPGPYSGAQRYLSSSEASAVQSWRHQLRRLDVSMRSLGHTVAAALPPLEQLRCWEFDVASPNLLHLSLTSLHAQFVCDLGGMAAFAPHLRTLHIGVCCQGYEASRRSPGMVWEALAALPRLKSLHLPLRRLHLTPSTGFCSTLQHLTALTHLGLSLSPTDFITLAPPDDALQATSALAELPLLASVDISNFRMLGGTLGSALLALPKLRILALDQQSNSSLLNPPGLPAGCLPTFSAVCSLEELTLTGGTVVGSEELQRASRGGLRPRLKALALEIAGRDHARVVCDLLAPLTVLTSLHLVLQIGTRLQQEDRLDAAVAQLTQLRRLQVHNMQSMLFPCLASLPALSCLEMHLGCASERAWRDMHVVEGMSGLRRLVLMSEHTTQAVNLQQFMVAVRKLPLLEDVEVGHAEWSGEDLGLLLPPPGQLTRLLLARPLFASSSSSSSSDDDSNSGSDGNRGVASAVGVSLAPGVDAAVEQLQSFGVHVILVRF